MDQTAAATMITPEMKNISVLESRVPVTLVEGVEGEDPEGEGEDTHEGEGEPVDEFRSEGAALRQGGEGHGYAYNDEDGGGEDIDDGAGGDAVFQEGCAPCEDEQAGQRGDGGPPADDVAKHEADANEDHGTADGEGSGLVPGAGATKHENQAEEDGKPAAQDVGPGESQDLRGLRPKSRAG